MAREVEDIRKELILKQKESSKKNSLDDTTIFEQNNLDEISNVDTAEILVAIESLQKLYDQQEKNFNIMFDELKELIKKNEGTAKTIQAIRKNSLDEKIIMQNLIMDGIIDAQEDAARASSKQIIEIAGIAKNEIASLQNEVKMRTKAMLKPSWPKQILEWAKWLSLVLVIFYLMKIFFTGIF